MVGTGFYVIADHNTQYFHQQTICAGNFGTENCFTGEEKIKK